jgi:type VI secretion system protein ImpA
MALVDSESLLRPISEVLPSGPNLEYDPLFADLERALVGKAEQQIGDVVTPAEDPDWNRVLRLSIDLLARTKDLRIACPLVRSLAVRHGLSGLDEGLLLIREMLSRYWADVHPQLDPDDNNDPTIRVNSLSALCGPEGIMSLRAAAVFQSRAFGPVTVRDCLAAVGSGETARVDASSIDAALQEMGAEGLGTLVGACDHVLDNILAIERTFEEHVGSAGPDMSRLTQMVRQLGKLFRPRLEALRAATAAANGGADQNGQSGALSTNGTSFHSGAPGEIRSRDDVVRTLDKICDYYRRYEPSSPIPFFLERCKRLVSMNFLDILRDMTPDALSQAEVVTGIKRES